MSNLKLAWKNLTNKPLSMMLSLVLFALGVGLISLIFLIEKQVQEKFDKNLADISLVVGAKGSPLQMILCNMYHVDDPTGNVLIEDVKPFMNPQHPLIEKAVPLSLGDSYKGFRIVGTTLDYPDLYGVKVAKGGLWSKNLEATIGADVARIAGLEIGSTFYSTHGFLNDGMNDHDHGQFTVIGIFEKSNSVIDQLILSTTQSIWEVHAHEEGTPEEAVETSTEEEHNHSDHDHDAENHAGHDHASHEGHDHSDHDHAGHDHTSENHAGHDHVSHEGHDHSDHDHTGHDHDSENHAGHDHASHEGHDHSDHDHTGHDHASENHAGHDHASHEGHDHSDHDHAGHDHDQAAVDFSNQGLLQSPDEEITALLLKFKESTRKSYQALNMLKGINENTEVLAASPAIELNKLYDNMAIGESFLRNLALIIVLVSGLSIFISLFNSLRDRKYELALMRVMGASPGKLFFLIVLEGLLLAVLGYIIGIVLSHLGMAFFGGQMQDKYHYAFSATQFLIEEFYLLGGALAIGFLAAIIPAIQAFRTDISETLTSS
ncbi:MAG: FtsX-like permease family protein [Bacteroidota bacterium]